jgi:anti-sigma B factor antagonist
MRITTTIDEGVTFLRVSGDVDLATADELGEAGEKALSELCSTLRIDLSEVTFLDSTGLGALIRIGNRAKPRPVILENPRPNVMRVLELTAMHHVFTIESETSVSSA